MFKRPVFSGERSSSAAITSAKAGPHVEPSARPHSRSGDNFYFVQFADAFLDHFTQIAHGDILASTNDGAVLESELFRTRSINGIDKGTGPSVMLECFIDRSSQHIPFVFRNDPEHRATSRATSSPLYWAASAPETPAPSSAAKMRSQFV